MARVDYRMTCCKCNGHVPVPEYGHLTICESCGTVYRLAADYGFFDYTAEVYEPVDLEEES